MEKPLEATWVGLKLGRDGASGNHLGKATCVSLVVEIQIWWSSASTSQEWEGSTMEQWSLPAFLSERKPPLHSLLWTGLPLCISRRPWIQVPNWACCLLLQTCSIFCMLWISRCVLSHQAATQRVSDFYCFYLLNFSHPLSALPGPTWLPWRLKDHYLGPQLAYSQHTTVQLRNSAL